MKWFGIAAAAALMTASAATAAITDEQIAGLKVGEATYSDVVAQLGRPSSVETSSDGSKTVTYSVSKTHLKAATFVPIVGLFAGGAKADTATDRFEFGADGVLAKVSTSTTHVNCGTWGGCNSK
ncbi:MAG TPA: hypothetical protein VFE10_10385 [Phenylobacterium sp.]|jgi:hypothetical protein|nr:hypothetical protein [Phenylobacterium sp.]